MIRRRTAERLAMIPSVPVLAVPMRDRRIVKLITSKDLIEKSILVEFE